MIMARFGTRAGLVAAALAVQSIVLSIGWFTTFRVVQRSFAMEIQARTIEQNRDLAERVASLFPGDIGTATEYGSPGWERLQGLIESDALAELPAGGFACLVEADGQLLCHPEIRESPGLRGYSFDGKQLLEGLEHNAAGEPVVEAGGDEGASGVIEFVAGDFHYVATKPLAGTSLRLLVHQPVGALVNLGKRNTRWVMGAAGLAVTVVLGVTGVGLGILLRRYDSMHEALNRRMRDNLQVARSIQQNTLPLEFPKVAGFDIAGWSTPADETGGDTFDAVGLPGRDGPACGIDGDAPAERIGLLLADATGHGIGPALAVTQLHAMTRLAWRLGGSLIDVARLVNEQLAERLPADRFVTAVFGVLDTRDGSLELLSAGQGPLFVFRADDGRIETPPTDTYPLGVLPELGTDSTARLTLGPGDIFCAISDGIIEAKGPGDRLFGAERLKQLLIAAAHGSPAQIADRIRREVERYTNGAAADDDRTVLIMKRAST